MRNIFFWLSLGGMITCIPIMLLAGLWYYGHPDDTEEHIWQANRAWRIGAIASLIMVVFLIALFVLMAI